MFSEIYDTYGVDTPEKLFGMDPPKGVYFIMEFEHNMRHPFNVKMNPNDMTFTGEPQRTMDEARTIAHSVALDYVNQMNTVNGNVVNLVSQEYEEDEEGANLPAYVGVDTTANVVFCVSVRFIDIRHHTIH